MCPDLRNQVKISNQSQSALTKTHRSLLIIIFIIHLPCANFLETNIEIPFLCVHQFMFWVMEKKRTTIRNYIQRTKNKQQQQTNKQTNRAAASISNQNQRLTISHNHFYS